MKLEEMRDDDEEVQTFEEGEEDDAEINMADVGDFKFITYPAGDYNVVIATCEYTKSESANKPMWKLSLEIEDGKFQGKKIPSFLSLSEGALPGTKAALKVLNPELANSSWKPQKVAEEGLLLGCRARIKLQIRPYQGQKRNNVRQWLPPTAANEFING